MQPTSADAQALLELASATEPVPVEERGTLFAPTNAAFELLDDVEVQPGLVDVRCYRILVIPSIICLPLQLLL